MATSQLVIRSGGTTCMAVCAPLSKQLFIATSCASSICAAAASLPST